MAASTSLVMLNSEWSHFLGGSSAGRFLCDRRRLRDGVIVTQRHHPVLVVLIGAFAFDIAEVYKTVEASLTPLCCLYSEIVSSPPPCTPESSAPLFATRVATELDLCPRRGQALAGSFATSRSETASSSSWKCGRRKATAL